MISVAPISRGSFDRLRATATNVYRWETYHESKRSSHEGS
jgi:hypothetical protein